MILANRGILEYAEGQLRLRSTITIGLASVAIAIFSLSILLHPHYAEAAPPYFSFKIPLDSITTQDPRAIAVDHSGNVYVGTGSFDTSRSEILKFSSNGTFLSRFGGDASIDGVQLIRPTGLAVNNTGYVFAGSENNYILVFDPEGNLKQKIGGGFYEPGKLYSPHNVAVNSTGYIFVAEDFNHRIQVFDSTGSSKQIIGGNITLAEINNQKTYFGPFGLTLDNKGNIFATDPTHGRILKFDSAGNLKSIFGAPDNVGTGIAINDTGYAYVAGNDRIGIYDPAGTFKQSFGTSGSGNGQFNFPVALALNNTGYLYVVDVYNHRIQVFSPFPPTSPTSATLAIRTMSNKSEIEGVWVTIRAMNGTLLKSGYTPMTFDGLFGTQYQVAVSNYDGKIFQHWQDNNNSPSNSRIVNLSADTTTLIAVYDTGDSLRGFTPLTFTDSSQRHLSLTVNALSLTNNQTLHMSMIIDPQQQTSSSGTTTTTYKVYATNRYQNFTFDHWQDTGSTDRFRRITMNENTTLTAYYKQTFPSELPRFNGKIAFSSTRDGNNAIYTMNPDGTNVTKLTNSTGFDSEPSWSPDGRKIVFFSDKAFPIES